MLVQAIINKEQSPEIVTVTDKKYNSLVVMYFTINVENMVMNLGIHKKILSWYSDSITVLFLAKFKKSDTKSRFISNLNLND